MELSPNEFLRDLARQVDPVEMFRTAVGFEPDDWQRALLQWPNGTDHPLDDPMLITLCSRGLGKTQVLALKALHHIETVDKATCVILAPSLRQSVELYRYMRLARDKLPLISPSIKETETELHFANGARIIVLPGSNPDAVRGFRSSLTLLEESARITDELFQAVVPMGLANAKIICATTPAGERGFTYDLFTEGNTSRIVARSSEIPRMKKIRERDRKIMTASAFAQEHDLKWSASGSNFFDSDMIAAAFSAEVEPLRIEGIL